MVNLLHSIEGFLMCMAWDIPALGASAFDLLTPLEVCKVLKPGLNNLKERLTHEQNFSYERLRIITARQHAFEHFIFLYEVMRECHCCGPSGPAEPAL